MTVVEKIALGAADAESADYDSYLSEAAAIVRVSPLAGWFPVTWRILDHNLPFSLSNDLPVLVIATPDEEETPSVPLRFGILRRGPAVIPQWETYLLDVNASEVNWLLNAVRVRTTSDVGRWIRQHRAKQ